MAALASIAAPISLIRLGHASDHADTPEIAASPGTDITDVYMFPSTSNSNNVVLAMNVHPLIARGQGGRASFDPNVLYQFKIDNNGDAVEDLVIQAHFLNQGPRQLFVVSAPTRPRMVGGSNELLPAPFALGRINTVWEGARGSKVFCGAREDSFFFDLEQFFNILPDRATPITGVPISDPNTPQQTTWRSPENAVDFLSNGGYNVLSIVVEVPKQWLMRRNGGSIVSVWTTTSVRHGERYQQMDRLARPVVNEVFATVANNRHKINDQAQPSQDNANLANDIQSFMTFPAGRSQAITDVVKAVLSPDMMTANLDGDGAAYLGYETGGATGGTFGGRALTDDVVDISLGVVFGNTIPALGLAPDDGNEIPTLTSDHVGPGGKHFLNHFPYLGNPR